MSQPIAVYYSNYDETYNNSFQINVNIYFYNIGLFAPDITRDSRGNQEKYVLSLKLNELKSELSFEMIFKNEVYSGILYINNNGNVSSYLSKSLSIYINNNNFAGNGIMCNFGQIFTLDFSIRDCRDLKTFRSAKVQVVLQGQEGQQAENNDMNNINKFLNKTGNNTEVEIYYQTDNLGVNLGEMLAKLTSDHSYPNGFPKKFIVYCNNLPTTNTTAIDTFYSFKPNLSKVLKLEGDCLLEQTNKINKKFNNVTIKDYEKNCYFFKSILAYSTLRYMLAGLSNNSIFSCKWLYSNNYNKFLRNLENSEFSYFLRIFTEYPNGYGLDDFTDYNKYFRSCEKHLQ